MPVDYKKYPADWKQIRERILVRAQNRCEFCNVQNYVWGWRKPDGSFVMCRGSGEILQAHREHRKVIRIVLTISHLNHDINDNSDENLRALCQRCHLLYDKELHMRNAKLKRIRKLQANMEDLI